MSLEFVEADSIKEEVYLSGDSEVANSAWFTESSSTKCGEVFLGQNKENFTFVCALCLQSFSNLPNFGEHIHKIHLLPKEEAPDVQMEAVLLIKSDRSEVGEAEPEIHNSEEDEKKPLDLKDPIQLGEDEEAALDTEDPIQLEEDESPLKTNKVANTKRKKTKPMKNDTQNDKPAKQKGANPSKTFCCFSCGKLFLVKASYRNHYRAEHPDMIEKDDIVDWGVRKISAFVPKVPSEMSCKFCLKTFHEPATYHSHVEFDHLDKIYSCLRCPATFTKSVARDYHVDAHEGKKRFPCPHCPAAFSHPSNRRTHINVHLNKKKFVCRFCDKKYVRGVDLRIHERIHTNEKPFQCEECGKSFNAQVKLTGHLRRHRNIKNYKCTHCDKAFFALGMLKAHIITHTTDSPFSCDICNQKFRALSSLRAHKLLHSDKKTFKCKVCGKMFAQYAGLYSHMKSHDGVE